MKKLLYLAVFLDAFTGLFWSMLPKGSFYILNALFLVILAYYIYKTDTKSFIHFCLFALCIGNFIDELFFNPTEIAINEFILIFSLPIIWTFKFRNK